MSHDAQNFEENRKGFKLNIKRNTDMFIAVLRCARIGKFYVINLVKQIQIQI